MELTSLRNQARLDALHESGLLGSAPELSFDRLTRLAARLLNARVALVSLLGQDHEFLKSAVGLEEPWASERQVPLSHSFCKYVVASGQPLFVPDAREHPLVRDNPAVRDLNVIAYAGIPLRSGNGQVLGGFCVIDPEPREWTGADVLVLEDLAASVETEIRFRMEVAERRRSDARYRSLFEGAQEGLFVVERDEAGCFRFTDANPRIAEITGTPVEKAVGARPRDVLPPDTAERVEALYARVFETGAPAMVEHTNALPKGRVTTRTRYSPVIGPAGHVERVLGMTEDITAQKAAEDELRQTKDRLTAFLDTVPEECWLKDRDGCYVLVNPAQARAMNRPVEEILGKRDADLFPAEVAERFVAGDRRALEEGTLWFEDQMRGADGQLRYFVIAKAALPGGDGVVGISHDITERKRAEEALRESEDHYRHMVELNPQVVWTACPDGLLDSVSPRWVEWTGNEGLGDTWAQAVHPEDVEPLVEVWSHAIATGQGSDYEYRVRMRDGSYRWVRSRAFPRRDPDGRIVRWYGSTEDIHERKQAEERLRASEQLFRAIFEGSNDAILVYRVEEGTPTPFVAANEVACQRLGYSREELLRRSLLDLAPEDASTRTARLGLLKRLGTHGHLLFETEHVRSDGARIPVEVNARWVDLNGTPAVVSIARDVSERKAAERALHESEERFRQLAENIDAVFWLSDLGKQEMIYVSPAYACVWGRSPESLYEEPRSFLDAIHPDDRTRVISALPRQIEGTYDEVYRVVRPDGSTCWVRDRAFPVRVGEGPIVRIAGIAEDITERKRMEEALQTRERQLAEAQSVAHLGSWDWDLARDGIDWSDEHYRIFGLEPQSVAITFGRFQEFLHPDDREPVQAMVETALREGSSFEFDQRVIRADGELRIVHARGRVITDDVGTPIRVVGTAQDITERRKLEEQLRQSGKLEAVGRLAGGIAHDFNNLLMAIHGNTQLAMHDLPRGSTLRDDLD